ncbi:lytic transglycosylase domain-containing protein [Streptomyces sp. ASQP_92]|uniref:lytic transglycosylase domain-containing protein n=1 Tax=Streptomyces sp. ASQP_92 TaxID=2979116 RepID=UPI0021BFD7F3|nr:lytic transglycosylase domain-containing protein [Streptomyces sp. ASQP_92]MCT9089560.1 lytic transglycosylase domain-containing protein [Streptomyces sp. ASQP_92]
MSRISVRGFAVASATAVTTVGAVVGVAAGSPAVASNDNFEATAADTTLLADIPAGQQAQVQTASLTQQADAQAAQASAAAKKSAEEAARVQAAQAAKDKKDAADKEKADKEAKARDLETQAASRSASRADFAVKSSYTIDEIQSIARQIVPAGQFQCFSHIVNNESSWNYQATNAGSGAYGLVQALPASKMSSAGSDWQTNPATQIKWGLNYMNERYGSPCGAWSYWQAHSWY